MVNIDDANFSFSAGTPTISQVIGRGLVLGLPVQVDARKYGRTEQSSKVRISIRPSELKLYEKLVGLTLPDQTHGMEITSTNTTQLFPRIQISGDALLELEAARAGRAAEFTLAARLVVQGERGDQIPEEGIKFRVAASDWTDMLTRVGLFSSLIVEVPLSGSLDPTTNGHLQGELRRAERLYQQGDFTSAVATLRDVWDPVVKELDPSGKWDTIFDKKLPTQMASEMKDYATRLRAIINKGHHRQEKAASGVTLYDFSAADAEFAYQTMMSFLRYLGKLAR